MDSPPVPSRWSFLDKFSPELFSFGFDPEILTLFWGLFQSSNDINAPAPRFIPSAPFQLLVPFHAGEGGSIFSTLQCGFATGGVVLFVTLSSFGVYSVLQSAREKYVKPGTVSSAATTPGSVSAEVTDLRLVSVEQSPARPTTLNVGARSVAHGSKFGILNFPGLRKAKQLRDEIELELDDVDDMADVQGEYFGPANVEDDSAGSSDFQTPCA